MNDVATLDVTWRSALLLALIAPTALIALRLMVQRTEAQACRWLGLFLLVFCLDTVPQIIGFADAYQVWPWLTFAPLSYQAWFGPLIYFHAHALIRKTPLGWRWWLLAPGVVQLVYYIWAFTSLGDYQAKWRFTDVFHDPYILPVQLSVSLGLTLMCGVATWRMIRRYRRFLAETQSVAAELDPSWLTRFLGAMSVAILCWLGYEVVDFFNGPLSYRARYPMFLVIGALFLWMGIEALARIRMSFVALGEPDVERVLEPPVPRAPDWQAVGQALQQRVIQEQWHLEPRLSMREVALRMGSNETYVSRGLNQGLGLNFNQMVNDVRVATAKTLMREAPQRQILDVALAAGFNSKATFNRVFRDRCGTTPSAWRRAQDSETSQVQ
ncbi:MAG: helix-turn-helix domain-containing protein [Gammaproteobacteria bacterium]